jgi:hypothetical protein
MDLMLLRTFQFQVQLQCRFVLKASDDIEAAIKQGKTREQVQDIFYSVQNLLNAAANISKALWGPKGKLAAQKEALRDSLGITNDSPLQTPDMRNNYEHFDDRLDLWWKNSNSRTFVDMTVLWSNPDFKGIDPTDRFRAYDPKTGDLSFWGQEFNLKAIVDEARRILPVALEEYGKPFA